MNDPLLLVGPLLAGAALGTVFFLGLWWTIRRCLDSRLAPLWFPLSLLLRTAITIAGFYLASRGQWPRLLACLLGFGLARLAVTWLTRVPAPAARPLGEDGR